MKRILHLGLAAILIALWPACNPPQQDPENPGTEVVDPENPNPQDPPAEYYFKMVSGYNQAEVPDTPVFNHRGGGVFYLIDVESNVEGWTAKGGADWCSINAYAGGKKGQINLYVHPYQVSGIAYPYPRTCTMTIQAPGVFDKTLVIGQESESTYLYTAPNQQTQYTLPASGATVDIPVLTNLVDWKIINETGWIKAEKINRITLRVSVVPANTPQPRSGKITLMSIANGQVGSYDTPWEINFTEGEPDVSGDDYDYGDGIEWD